MGCSDSYCKLLEVYCLYILCEPLQALYNIVGEWVGIIMSVDVIFIISMQSNIRDSEVMDMLIMLILDFIDEYLSLTTDRKTKIISQSFKGPEKDISFSLDHSTPEQISRESWLDLSDAVLASIRRDWNMKASRKGLFVYYISGCPGFVIGIPGFIIGTHDCPKYLKRSSILCTVDHL